MAPSILLLFVAIFSIVPAQGSRHDSIAEGFAVQRVVNKLEIRKISDLNFGEAAPGDRAKTIPPGSSDNAENASFLVQGEAGRAFYVFLPRSVKMTLGKGGRNREIEVEKFRSNPDGRGRLNGNGEALILVGATREALDSRLKSGDYSGTFTVTVVY